MRTSLRCFIVIGLIPFASLFAAEKSPASPATAPAAAPAKPQPSPQFIYVLRLIPRLHDDTAWTKTDEAVLGRHIAHLKAATESGQIILAGRTMESGDKTFGLVIFTAADDSAARAFMNSDPTVAEGLMTATLHPYAIAFRGK